MRQHLRRQKILEINHGSAIGNRHSVVGAVMIDRDSLKHQLNEVARNGNVARKIIYSPPNKPEL